MKQFDPKKYVGLDNRDLRLRNVTDIDMLFYKHKIFITTLQNADSIAAAAKKLNMSPKSVVSKASHLRQQGVELRFFHWPMKIHREFIERLKAIVKKSPMPKESDIEKLVTLWPTMKNGDIAKELGWTKERVVWTSQNLRKAGVDLAVKRRDYQKLRALADPPKIPPSEK